MATTSSIRARILALGLAAALAALMLCAAGAPAAAGGKPAAGSRSPIVHIEYRRASQRASSSRSQLSIVTVTPASGRTVSGAIAWQVEVLGATPSRVDFAIDGVVKASRSSAPLAYAGSAGLDTRKLSNGKHTLTAIAYGSRRTQAVRSTVTITVANAATSPSPAPAPAPAPVPVPPPAPAPQPAPAPAPSPSPAPAPAPTPSPTPEPEPAPSPAPVPSPAASSIYWGGWIGKQLTGEQPPWDMGAVSKFEQMAGKKLSIVNFSAPFANCPSSGSCSFYNFPANEMSTIRSHGAIPSYSWASQSIPSKLTEPDFQLADVLAGTYDAYIRKFATAAKNWGHPFFLRFNWEMNGGWFPWSEGVNGNKSGEFVAAWRHVHDIFTSVGATNATWIWCPNVDFQDDFQDLSTLYPGDAYVDWTGLDGYNWGTNPAKPDRWRSFDQLYSSTYHRIVDTIAPSKPLMISEIGSSELGGSKAAWIKDALARIPASYPKIRGVLWFEQFDDGMDWPIETSSSATSAFAAGIQNPAYGENTYGALGFGPIFPAG